MFEASKMKMFCSKVSTVLRLLSVLVAVAAVNSEFYMLFSFSDFTFLSETPAQDHLTDHGSAETFQIFYI